MGRCLGNNKIRPSDLILCAKAKLLDGFKQGVLCSAFMNDHGGGWIAVQVWKSETG